MKISYAIWKVLPDGNLAKLRIANLDENIVNNDLQKIIKYELRDEKSMSSRLVDLSPENKIIDVAIKVPVLFKDEYYYSFGSEFFYNKDRKLLISRSSESKLNNLFEIRNFLPVIYQKNISITQNKPIKFTNESSVIYGLDVDTNRFNYVIPRPGRISDPIISPDGKTMFFIEENSSVKLTVWNTLTGEFLREINLIARDFQGELERRVKFTPDGKKLVIVESNGILSIEQIEPYISIWNVEELRNP